MGLSEFIQIGIGFATLLVTIIIGWPKLKNRLQKNPRRNSINITNDKNIIIPRWHLTKISRRAFFATVASGLGCMIVFYFIRTGVLSKKHLNPGLSNIIVNKKTKIIHHKDICVDHLPSENNQIISHIDKADKYHKVHAANILYQLACKASDKDAVVFLLQAIAIQPKAIHVYDKLIRILGKLKKYELIHYTLKKAKTHLSEKMNEFQIGSKKYLELEKARSSIVERERQVFAKVLARKSTT